MAIVAEGDMALIRAATCSIKFELLSNIFYLPVKLIEFWITYYLTPIIISDELVKAVPKKSPKIGKSIDNLSYKA